MRKNNEDIADVRDHLSHSNPSEPRDSWWYQQLKASRSKPLPNHATSEPDPLRDQLSTDRGEPSVSCSTEAQASWWYQQLKATHREAPRQIEVKVVGVTFENRQNVVAQMQVGEQVLLRREPQNPHDANAIRVERENGQIVGYLGREWAAALAPAFDKHGEPVPATVVAIVGTGHVDCTLGVRIKFSPPQGATVTSLALVKPDELDF